MRKQYVRYDEYGVIIPMSLTNYTPTRKMVGEYGYKAVDELRKLEYPRKRLRAFLRMNSRGVYTGLIVAKSVPRRVGRFVEIPYSLSGAIDPVNPIDKDEIVVTPGSLEEVTTIDIEAGESITLTYAVPNWSVGEAYELTIRNTVSSLPTIVTVANPEDPYKDNQTELNEKGISISYSQGTWTVVFDEELAMEIAQNQSSVNISFVLEIKDIHNRTMYDGEDYYSYKVVDVTPPPPEPEPDPEPTDPEPDPIEP